MRSYTKPSAREPSSDQSAVRSPLPSFIILDPFPTETQNIVHVLRPRRDPDEMQRTRFLGTILVRLHELHQHRRPADFAIASADGHAEAPLVQPKRPLEPVQRETIGSIQRQVNVDGMLLFRHILPLRIIFLTSDFAANYFGQPRLVVEACGELHTVIARTWHEETEGGGIGPLVPV